ncbi:MAG: hypothetical protein K8R54_06930 [Bacteroidales bacterium]|nr:hypothetical protein [Bacteroidales bacterium]
MTSIYKIPEEPDTSQIESQIRFYTRFAWGIVFLGLIIGILFFIIPNNSCFKDFGDYTGGVVASLWSLAGLFIIYVAFLGQKKEIKLQQYEIKLNRAEIKLSTQELKGQKQQMVQQNETIKKQQFEHGFFSLLNMLSEIGKINNREKYPAIARKLFDDIKHRRAYTRESITSLEIYHSYEDNFFNSMNHFFSNFILIIRFVSEKKIDLKQKEYYINIAITHLSEEEFFVLAIYNFSNYNPKIIENDNKELQIKKLIENHYLFRQLIGTKYFKLLNNINFYERTAYSKEPQFK